MKLLSRYCLQLCVLTAMPLAAEAQPQRLEIGYGYSNNDGFNRGQYGNYANKGGMLSGGFSLHGSDGQTDYWQIQGGQLGLDSATLSAGFGRWGSYRFQLDIDSLQHSEIDTFLSPFTGYGTDLQSLPAGWIGAANTSGLAALETNLNRFAIRQQRQRVRGNLEWQLRPAWELNAEYRHETKKGNDTLGAIFGSSGGNPRGALLARPVDFTTRELRLGVDHAQPLTQYGVSYTFSDFENADLALRWDNPFNNAQWLPEASFSRQAEGQLALEPDNKYALLNLYLAHSFSPTTRLNMTLNHGSLRQDDDFLPYSSVVAAPVPLPRNSLRGRVAIRSATITLSSRFSQYVGMQLRYSYRDRDNQTRQSLFQRVAGDVAPQSGLLSDGARINRLYDQNQQRISLGFDYRASTATRVSLGFEAEEIDRSMLDVESTTEQTSFIKLDLRPLDLITGWLKLSHSEREVSGLDTTRPLLTGHNPDYIETLVGNDLFENDPYLRRYHISARRRDELSAALNYYPSELWGVSLLARVSNNDYPGTLVGVVESGVRRLTADLSITPAARWSGGLYWSVDNFDNRQLGYSRTGGGSPTVVFPASSRNPSRNWKINSEDRVNTVGGNLNWGVAGDRILLGLDASYSSAETSTDPYSTGLAWLPFPEVTTRITALEASGAYRLAAGHELRLRLLHERYQSRDFALDKVLVNTLANVLLPGNPSPHYSRNVIELSFAFELP